MRRHRRTAFANTFREVLGQTPADYLSDWRMAWRKTGCAKGAPSKSCWPKNWATPTLRFDPRLHRESRGVAATG